MDAEKSNPGNILMNIPKPNVGMLPTDRLDYSPITDRKPLKLPNNARMVVWTVTNVEDWDPTQTMPRTVLTPPAGGSPMPDIPNWCWHEYGNRVGFWRLLEVYDEFKIPGVMNINGVAVEAYPELVKACVDRNSEFVGHGYTQRNMQKVENERSDIKKSAEVIEKATGKRPRGWLGPGLTETWETPDVLAEERGLLIAYPAQARSANASLCWNWIPLRTCTSCKTASESNCSRRNYRNGSKSGRRSIYGFRCIARKQATANDCSNSSAWSTSATRGL